jgi:hypothetical protein
MKPMVRKRTSTQRLRYSPHISVQCQQVLAARKNSLHGTITLGTLPMDKVKVQAFRLGMNSTDAALIAGAQPTDFRNEQGVIENILSQPERAGKRPLGYAKHMNLNFHRKFGESLQHGGDRGPENWIG